MSHRKGGGEVEQHYKKEDTGQAKMREQISSSHHSRGASWEGSTHARSSSKGGWAQQHSSTHMGCPCLATLVFFFLPGHCGRHRWQRERERWGSGSSAVVHHMSCTKAFCWVCFRLASTASSPQARKGQPAFCACSASSLEARRTRPWCTRTPPQSLHPSGKTRASWGQRPPAEEPTSAP